MLYIKKTRWSFKKQSYIAIMLLVIPMLVTNVWFYLYVKNTTEQDVHNTFTLLTQNIAIQSINQQLTDIKSNIITLSNFADAKDVDNFINNNSGELKKLISYTLNSSRFFSNILFMNSEEKFNSIPFISQQDIQPSTRPWFKIDSNKNNLITFTEPYIDILNKKPSISVSKNLYDSNGKSYGLVSMGLDLHDMSQILEQVKVPLSGDLYIVHKDGHIIMNPNNLLINSEISNLEWLKKINSLQNYFYDSQTKTYVYYYVFPEPNWVMFLTVPNQELQLLISNNLHSFIIIGIISLMLYIAVSMLWNANFQRMMSELLSSIKNGRKQEYISQPNEFASIYNEIYKQHQEKDIATQAAKEDELTGLYNRRAFNYYLNSLIDSNTNFSISMIDIDNFKAINDTYGHTVGDLVLQKISHLGFKYAGSNNLLFRYGGEEIIIIFVNSRFNEALQRVNEWREEVQSLTWPGCEGLQVTFSGGFLIWTGQTANEVLTQVDKFLYKAKSSGKNNITSPH